MQDTTLQVVSLATEACTADHRDLTCTISLEQLLPSSEQEPYGHALRFCRQLGERKR